MAARRKTTAAPAAKVPPAATRGELDASDVQLPPSGFGAEGGLFDFDARPVVTNWPAEVKYPVAGGRQARAEIRLDLEYLTMDEVRKLDQAVAEFIAGGGKHGGAGDPLAAKVRGWSGIGSEGKGALAFSEAARGRLLADTRFRQAVTVSLAKIAMGIEEKNSETPPAAGPAPRAGLNRAERRRIAKQLANAGKATA